MTEQMKQAIQKVIKDLMDSVMNKVLYKDPFLKEVHYSEKPLYAALVPDEIFKGSHFERRFVTPFGNVWERLAVVAANNGLGFGTTGYRIDGFVREERLHRIQETLNKLEYHNKGDRRIKPDWNKELKYILEGKGELIPTSVICDVYLWGVRRHSGRSPSSERSDRAVALTQRVYGNCYAVATG